MESENCPSRSNKSNGEEERSHVEYNATGSNRAVGETFTLVDVCNKFVGIKQSCIPEKCSLDYGEEKECKHSADITKHYEGSVLCGIMF